MSVRMTSRMSARMSAPMSSRTSSLVRRVALAALAVVVPQAALAQRPLLGARTVSTGAVYETWSFGDGGALQPGLGTADGVRVRRASQLSVPIAVVVPLGARWTMDLATAYTTGVVTLARDDAAAGAAGQYRLDGLADVRLRAVGRLVGDNVLVTLGANAPTGRASLRDEQLGALRVLAAPALALSTPALGTGPGGTAGVVLARSVGSWALAAGASYELRGAYQPIATLAAGAPATDDPGLDFDPGDALHLSLGTDRLVGESRATLGVTVDLFGADRLRGGPLPGTVAVRLGPLVTAEWQLRMAPHGLRELRLAVVDRYRFPYARDGEAVPGTGGNYLDASVDAVWPLSRSTGILAALDGRHHSGLPVDDSFATARVLAGGLALGLVHDVGAYRVQPLLRARYGTLETAAGRPTPIVGLGAALSVATRF